MYFSTYQKRRLLRYAFPAFSKFLLFHLFRCIVRLIAVFVRLTVQWIMLEVTTKYYRKPLINSFISADEVRALFDELEQ